jgi:hypothetical protein
MSPKISLEELVDTFETLSDEVQFFLNPKSGAIAPLTQEDRYLLDSNKSPDGLPQWQQESLKQAREILDSDDWLELPHRSAREDWEIMEAFCNAQSGEVRDELREAIDGRGAFRVFRSAIHRLGLRDAWFAFRRGELEALARDWLEARQLPFE